MSALWGVGSCREKWDLHPRDFVDVCAGGEATAGSSLFGKRYLIPALGTWASPDPLAVHSPGSADLNLYAFVHGRLLAAVDPTGLDEANLTSDPNNLADQKYAEESLGANKSQSTTVHAGKSAADTRILAAPLVPPIPGARDDEVRAAGDEALWRAQNPDAAKAMDEQSAHRAKYADLYRARDNAETGRILSKAGLDLARSALNRATNVELEGSLGMPSTASMPEAAGPMQGPVRMYGPFIHHINKGGYTNIMAEQQLVATEARDVAGGTGQVRAYQGTLDAVVPKQGRQTIEFFSHAPPTGENPGQRSVFWSMESGSRLDILVRRSLPGDGSARPGSQ